MPPDQVRQDAVDKIVEGLNLPHKVGIVGGKPREQLVDVVARALGEKKVHILGEVLVAQVLHRAGKPAGDQLLFLGQVNAVLALDKAHQPDKIFF